MPEFRKTRFVSRERGNYSTARPTFDDSTDTPDEVESQAVSRQYTKPSIGPQWAFKDEEARPKLDLMASAIENELATFSESDFVDRSNRNRYRALRSAQEQLRQKVKPASQDGRSYNPSDMSWPNTASGTAARLSSFTSVDGKPQLRRKSALLPCIQRVVRRSVMFAVKRAGRGYHTKKRYNSNSWIDC